MFFVGVGAGVGTDGAGAAVGVGSCAGAVYPPHLRSSQARFYTLSVPH